MTDERTTATSVATIAARLREVMADAREVVLHWRAAHADLVDVPSGGSEAARLRTEMKHLRAEYARLIEEARRCVPELESGDGPPALRDA
jgi:acyl transferase domain-containing protein